MLFRTPIRPGDLRREEEGQGGPLTEEGEKILAQREKEDADRKIWDKIDALFFKGDANYKFVHEIVDGLTVRQLEELHPFLDISNTQESIQNALAYLELSDADRKKQKDNHERMLEIRNELTKKIELDDYPSGEPIEEEESEEDEEGVIVGIPVDEPETENQSDKHEAA